MRVFVSVDMEGATGVVHPHQVDEGRPEYTFGRRMQFHDMLAVAQAAVDWGASAVLVNDSHDTMINLDASLLPEEIELISGYPKMLGMMEGAKDSDVALFVCYHAMAGTERGVLDHTMDSRTVHDVRLNGRRIGEVGLNALLCGRMGVPVALVTGDEAVCLESSSLLGDDLVTCTVKEGHGRNAAHLLSPEATGKRLREATLSALDRARQGRAPLWNLEPPYREEIEFHLSVQCDEACQVPGSQRLDGRTLLFETEDAFETRRWLNACIDTATMAWPW